MVENEIPIQHLILKDQLVPCSPNTPIKCHMISLLKHFAGTCLLSCPTLDDDLIYSIRYALRDAKLVLKLLPRSPRVMEIEGKMIIILCFMFTERTYCLARMY